MEVTMQIITGEPRVFYLKVVDEKSITLVRHEWEATVFDLDKEEDRKALVMYDTDIRVNGSQTALLPRHW